MLTLTTKSETDLTPALCYQKAAEVLIDHHRYHDAVGVAGEWIHLVEALEDWKARALEDSEAR